MDILNKHLCQGNTESQETCAEDYDEIADEVSCRKTLQIWHDGEKNTTECGDNSQCFRHSESIIWQIEVSKENCEKRVETKKDR